MHGVLPSSRWYSASSRRIQFHWVHVGDSGAVVTPFVQVATYATRNLFRYLRTVRVTAAVYRGFHSKLITLLLPTFQHRAGVRLYTSCYHLAESCVFNKQSLPPGMCRFPNPKIGGRAPLLPKLRGHFAEFLQHGSLKRPSILYLFTRVGLGYG